MKTDQKNTPARPMDIRAFAEKHRFKPEKDACGDPLIAGKHGDIGEYDDSRLCACFWGTDASKTRNRRIRATADAHIGQLIQRGDDEAQFAFDPADPVAAQWFIRSLEVCPKRVISIEHRERLHRLSEAHSPIRKRPQSAPGASVEARTEGEARTGQVRA